MELIDPSLLEIPIEIPHAFRPTLAANRHILPKFGAAVVKAIKDSFEHPDTRMREPTRQSVKDRVELAYEALRVMYFEEKVSLTQSLDILSGTLIDTLRAGVTIGMLTDGRGKGPQSKRWGIANSAATSEVDDASDLNADGEQNGG